MGPFCDNLGSPIHEAFPSGEVVDCFSDSPSWSVVYSNASGRRVSWHPDRTERGLAPKLVGRELAIRRTTPISILNVQHRSKRYTLNTGTLVPLLTTGSFCSQSDRFVPTG